jgi:hypothetical protein
VVTTDDNLLGEPRPGITHDHRRHTALSLFWDFAFPIPR